MSLISIDGKEYNFETFSEEAKAQLASIHFVDAELVRIQGQIAALQTARVAYSNELKKHLELIAENSGKLN